MLEFFVIDYVFNELKLSKLNCEVIEHNDAVVRLHEKFGFKNCNLEFLQYGIYEEPQSWNIAGEGTVNLIYTI